MVTRPGIARLLIRLAALAALWSAVALVTGGARFQLGGLTMSSRNPVRPALVCLFLLLMAGLLNRRDIDRICGTGSRWLTKGAAWWVPTLAAVAIFVTGVAYGGRAAIAADQSGYVSQSMLWRRGNLHIDVPLAEQMPWPGAIDTFTPIGYRSINSRTLVPFYPAGLPILMAMAASISACGVFLIVPLCAAATPVLTWLFGTRLFGSGVGLAGAVMTAASPVVITWTLTPMSDVPAAAFWLGALFAADRRTTASAVLAGALSGVAILIRPNLAPLVMSPIVLAMGPAGRRETLTRLAAVAVGLLPAGAFLLWLNVSLYGSPLSLGYGDFSMNFSWRHVASNLARYPVWWWTAHGVFGWLFVLSAPWRMPVELRWRTYTLIGFVTVVALSYVFYLPFDDWTFLRFTMPALPILMLLSAHALSRFLRPFGPEISRCGIAALALLAVVQGVHAARSSGAFRHADVNQRFVDAARYIDATTPTSSVIVSSLHSGSVAYYSGRLVLRYDLLDPRWLDRALDHVRAMGFETYALLEEWEERALRERFPDATAMRVLQNGPIAIRHEAGGELQLYHWNTTAAVPVDIPRSSRFDCFEASPRFAVPVELPIR